MDFVISGIGGIPFTACVIEGFGSSFLIFSMWQGFVTKQSGSDIDHLDNRL